jgi:hypothetical protein
MKRIEGSSPGVNARVKLILCAAGVNDGIVGYIPGHDGPPRHW